jgi:hemoglobin/transferrin/lactoferrin receptor protein
MLPFRNSDRSVVRRTAPVCAALLVVLCAQRAFAAPPVSAPPDTLRPVTFLKEVLVTGSRYPRRYFESPQALSFVSRSQLLELAPTSLGDVLQLLPGVDNSKDSPWEQRPVLRGMSGQRVLVLMDGSPMNSARGNGPHPSLADPAQVERIEVVRGPSSVAYGSDALGGVINIITREGLTDADAGAFAGTAEIGGSSADRQRHGYLELQPRIGKLTTFLSGGGRKAENFRAPDGEVKNSAFSDYHALGNLRYDLTDKLALKGGYQRYRGRDIGIPGLSFDTPLFSQAFAFPFYDRDYAHLSLEHVYAGSWLARTHVQTYWQREHRDFFSHEDADVTVLPPGPPPPPGAQRQITNQSRIFDLSTWGAQAQMTSRKTAHSVFVAGVDYAQDGTDGDNIRHRWFLDSSGQRVSTAPDRITASVPDGTFRNVAGFGQADWTFDPRWTMSAGGRLTHHQYRTDAGVNVSGHAFAAQSVDHNALSGSLGLVFAARPDLHLSANVANGYRQPNAQDLFFSGPASVGLVIGNEGLQPEKSVSYDLGLRWGPGDLALSTNLFWSTFTDLIDAVSVPPPSYANGQPTYQYINISAARIYGAEGELRWSVRPRWEARAAVSGAVGDITSRAAILTLYGANADQAPLSGVPPVKGSAALRYQNTERRFWLEAGTRWSWRTNRLPLPTPGVGQLTDFKKEWIVGDVSGGVKLATAQRLVLGVRNVTNRRYRQALASLQDPGVSLFVSVASDF